MQQTILRLDAAHVPDFWRLHTDICRTGWCFCAAWWVPTWEGFGARSAEDNRAVREALFARGEYDGYLLYVEGEPAGWCQVGPRDRLAKLVKQFWREPEFALEPDAAMWAITCFLIQPERRGQGLAAALLGEVLADLRARGVRRVEAFPKRGDGLDALDLWNGPEAMFRRAGFVVVKDDPVRPVLALALAESD